MPREIQILFANVSPTSAQEREMAAPIAYRNTYGSKGRLFINDDLPLRPHSTSDFLQGCKPDTKSILPTQAKHFTRSQPADMTMTDESNAPKVAATLTQDQLVETSTSLRFKYPQASQARLNARLTVHSHRGANGGWDDQVVQPHDPIQSAKPALNIINGLPGPTSPSKVDSIDGVEHHEQFRVKHGSARRQKSDSLKISFRKIFAGSVGDHADVSRQPMNILALVVSGMSDIWS